MPMLHLKTFLTVAHLLGLTIGLGGATILDFLLCRLVIRGRAIQQSDADLIHVISQLVSCALVVLWISGISFFIQYWIDSPGQFDNPKWYAKVAIVVVLTLNGVLLHARVLPIVRRRVGLKLFDGLQPREQFLMLACGAVSVISWYTPFFLGISKEMSFSVSASSIVAVYATLVIAAIGVAQLVPMVLRLVARRHAEPLGLSLKLTAWRSAAARAMTEREESYGQVARQRFVEATPEAQHTIRPDSKSWPARASDRHTPSSGSDQAA